jgi:hypothetical protein
MTATFPCSLPIVHFLSAGAEQTARAAPVRKATLPTLIASEVGRSEGSSGNDDFAGLLARLDEATGVAIYKSVD